MDNKVKSSILFICPDAYGHFIKTSKIARFYERKGFNIHYLIQGGNKEFLQNNSYSFTLLSTKIFGYYYSNIKKLNKIQKWYREYSDRKFKTRFYPRMEEIQTLLEQYKPKIIFIDIFCISDFLFCYSYGTKNNARIIGISPFFPEVKNSIVPPLNSNQAPGNKSFKLWEIEKKKEKLKKLKKSILFPFRTREQLIIKAMKKLNIPEIHLPNYWKRYPIFQNIDFWHLQPLEMDFMEQNLPNLNCYLGPMIDTDLSIEKNIKLDFFISMKKKQNNSKLIFCSLGTVILQQMSTDRVIDFFNKIIAIGKLNPNWFFAIKAPKKICKNLSPSSINVMIFDSIPYQKTLNISDVFITHGGGNSYLEAIYGNTPMLVVPPVSDWDYNGVAARIVLKKIGVVANFEDSILSIENHINELLSNPIYLIEMTKYQQLFQKKYHENYLDFIEMPLTTRNK